MTDLNNPPILNTLGSNSPALQAHWDATPGNQKRWVAFTKDVIALHSQSLSKKPKLQDFYQQLAHKRAEIAELLGHNTPALQNKAKLPPEFRKRLDKLAPNCDLYGFMRQPSHHDHEESNKIYHLDMEKQDDQALLTRANRLLTTLTHQGKYADQILALGDQFFKLYKQENIPYTKKIKNLTALLPDPILPNMGFKMKVPTHKITLYLGGKLPNWKRDHARFSTLTLFFAPPISNYTFPPRIEIDHMSADLLQNTFDEIEPLWQKLLAWDGVSVEAFNQNYHHLMWYLAQMSPLCRGSAAVTNWALLSLRTYHHQQYHKTPIEPYLEGVNWDLIAIFSESPEIFSEIIPWLYPCYAQEITLPDNIKPSKLFNFVVDRLKNLAIPEVNHNLKTFSNAWFLSDSQKVQQIYGYVDKLYPLLKPEKAQELKQICNPSLIASLQKMAKNITFSFDNLKLSEKQVSQLQEHRPLKLKI